jgi:hypothetical protein
MPYKTILIATLSLTLAAPASAATPYDLPAQTNAAARYWQRTTGQTLKCSPVWVRSAPRAGEPHAAWADPKYCQIHYTDAAMLESSRDLCHLAFTSRGTYWAGRLTRRSTLDPARRLSWTIGFRTSRRLPNAAMPATAGLCSSALAVARSAMDTPSAPARSVCASGSVRRGTTVGRMPEESAHPKPNGPEDSAPGCSVYLTHEQMRTVRDLTREHPHGRNDP